MSILNNVLRLSSFVCLTLFVLYALRPPKEPFPGSLYLFKQASDKQNVYNNSTSTVFPEALYLETYTTHALRMILYQLYSFNAKSSSLQNSSYIDTSPNYHVKSLLFKELSSESERISGKMPFLYLIDKVQTTKFMQLYLLFAVFLYYEYIHALFVVFGVVLKRAVQGGHDGNSATKDITVASNRNPLDNPTNDQKEDYSSNENSDNTCSTSKDVSNDIHIVSNDPITHSPDNTSKDITKNASEQVDDDTKYENDHMCTGQTEGIINDNAGNKSFPGVKGINAIRKSRTLYTTQQKRVSKIPQWQPSKKKKEPLSNIAKSKRINSTLHHYVTNQSLEPIEEETDNEQEKDARKNEHGQDLDEQYKNNTKSNDEDDGQQKKQGWKQYTDEQYRDAEAKDKQHDYRQSTNEQCGGEKPQTKKHQEEQMKEQDKENKESNEDNEQSSTQSKSVDADNIGHDSHKNGFKSASHCSLGYTHSVSFPVQNTTAADRFDEVNTSSSFGIDQNDAHSSRLLDDKPSNGIVTSRVRSVISNYKQIEARLKNAYITKLYEKKPSSVDGMSNSIAPLPLNRRKDTPIGIPTPAAGEASTVTSGYAPASTHSTSKYTVINLLDKKYYKEPDNSDNLYDGPQEIATELGLKHKGSNIIVLTQKKMENVHLDTSSAVPTVVSAASPASSPIITAPAAINDSVDSQKNSISFGSRDSSHTIVEITEGSLDLSYVSQLSEEATNHDKISATSKLDIEHSSLSENAEVSDSSSYVSLLPEEPICPWSFNYPQAAPKPRTPEPAPKPAPKPASAVKLQFPPEIYNLKSIEEKELAILHHYKHRNPAVSAASPKKISFDSNIDASRQTEPFESNIFKRTDAKKIATVLTKQKPTIVEESSETTTSSSSGDDLSGLKQDRNNEDIVVNVTVSTKKNRKTSSKKKKRQKKNKKRNKRSHR